MSDYQITLHTRDGHDVNFSCTSDSDVLSAAEQAAIMLPSLCRDGGCGACLGHCDSGEYSLGKYSDSVLSATAVAAGQVLLCRTYPQSDLHITAPYDYNQIHTGKQSARQAIITKLEKIAERTMLLQLALVNDKAVEFEPGQYMELEIPDTSTRRAYSLANSANWRGELEFLIRLQPEGKFSSYLSQQATIAQELKVYGPSGSFGLQNNRFNPLIFIAGGTGLAPFLSMLRRMAEWGEDRPIQLFLGVNQESELFFADELQQLKQQLPGLNLTLCVWKPAADWQAGFSGTPAEALQQYLQDQPANYDIYLCGPPLLVTAASRIAVQLGIPEQQIFAEQFT